MDRPMKIALVSAFDYASHGGVNDHVRNLAAQFRGWGHSVKVIAPCSAPQRISDDNFIPMGRPVPIPSGGSIARVSLSVWLRPRIKALLRDEAFDIIHLHNPFSGFVPVSVLGFSKAVNIATFHAYGATRLYRIGGTRLAKRYFRRLHGLIAVSEPAREFISRYFPGDYEIIPNGIQVEYFTDGVSPFPHLKDGMVNLLFLGRLEKRKGLKYLVAAYGRLKGDWPNLRLLVVGPGSPDRDSGRILSEGNLQDVVFVGRVPDQDKARYYKTADIFCSPATGKESFGVVLLEAMAAGKPIVATSIEGYSSVITNGREGLLVPPENDEALADAIAALLKDRDLRTALAANGQRRAKEFRWERVARRVMDYYLTCVERKTASAQ